MSGLSLYSRVGRNGTKVIVPPANLHHWNPGNYIAEASYDSNSLFNAIAARLSNQNDPAGNYKGVMIRMPWRSLETAFGVYGGFTAIETRLSQIAALSGRRLIIFIQLKTFNSKDSNGNITSRNHSVPDYMRASATYADPQGYKNDLGEHGEYGYKSSIGGPGGYVPNMHVAAVRARFEALMQAFATRFNGDERLEAVVINEASIAEPYQVTDVNGTWKNQSVWYSQMKTGLTTAKNALQNIQISQWINGPRAQMSTQANYTAPLTGWVKDITAAGVGLGMTDLALNDVGFQYVPPQTPGGENFSDHPGNIYLINKLGRGNGIIVGHASAECYRGSVANRNQGITNNETPAYPGPKQTRQETQAFAKNIVGVTHLCWVHNTSPDPYNPGKSMNKVTDEFIANPASDISTVETRPTGW